MRKTVVLMASVAAVLLTGVVPLAATQDTARAAFSGINGKIAFTRDPDGYEGP